MFEIRLRILKFKVVDKPNKWEETTVEYLPGHVTMKRELFPILPISELNLKKHFS